MYKVFITRKINEIAFNTLKKHFEVTCFDENKKFPADQIQDIADNYDAVLAMPNDVFNAEIIAAAKRLKVISVCAAGMDNIDTVAAGKKGIKVFNLPETVTISTAEHTFALLLALNRRLPESEKYIRNGLWKSWDPEIFHGMDLFGKVIGIVGFGRIGKEVAKRAAGFGMKILFYDIQNVQLPGELAFGAIQTDLDTLVRQSDIVSVHVPLDKTTGNLFNISLFKKMKRNALFINMARGKVVCTDDLIKALENKYIRGAALDVTDPEPIPFDHPLLSFSNCLVTPHIGTATSETRYKMAEKAAVNILNYFYPND